MKPTPAKVTAALSALFAFGMGVNLLLWWLSPPGFDDTALRQATDMLLARSGDDSWGPMAIALEYLASPGPKPLYSAIFFEGGIKFQYPPSALFGLLGLEALWPGHVRTSDGMSFGAWPAINDIVGWIFLAMSAAASAAVLEIRLAQLHGGQDWRRLRWLRCILVAGLTVTFYPLVKAFTLGQIQVWINGLFALATLFWVMKRPAWCGALVGLICLVKPHYGLLLAWAAIRREWRLVAAGALVGAVGLAASISVFGLSHHLDYLNVLKFMSERGEAYYANQSVNGLLNRIMVAWQPGLYAIDDFSAMQFPPYSPWVYWPTLASSLLLLLAALLPGRESDAAYGFAVTAISATIASPIAWEHHYGIFLPLYMLVFPAALRNRNFLWGVAASYLLVALHIAVMRQLAPTVFNVLQSYGLFGAFIFLLQLYPRLSYGRLASLTNPRRYIGRSS
ncbi:MAG: glycosyltransferase family 87 protein [Parvibaculaceae bacterium]